MSKKSKKAAEEKPVVKEFEIVKAALKDDYCNYDFDMLVGPGTGDTIKVTGAGIIDKDLRDAFFTLNRHLAAIDDAFKRANITVDNIDNFENHELSGLYHVTEFKIKGSADNESIILIGNKYVTQAGDRMYIETPRILLETGTSYTWYNELKEAANVARHEVELYKGGKCTSAEEEVDPKQMKITDGVDEEDFEDAKV